MVLPDDGYESLRLYQCCLVVELELYQYRDICCAEYAPSRILRCFRHPTIAMTVAMGTPTPKPIPKAIRCFLAWEILVCDGVDEDEDESLKYNIRTLRCMHKLLHTYIAHNQKEPRSYSRLEVNESQICDHRWQPNHLNTRVYCIKKWQIHQGYVRKIRLAHRQ
jgi:hypothetical protein